MNYRWLSYKLNRAFTLIEILLALSIIGLLTMIAVPNYAAYIRRVDNTLAIADMQDLEQRIAKFVVTNNTLPANLNLIGGAPLDPWGNPYQYLNIALAKGKGKLRKDKNLVPINTDYDLYSMGPDGQSVSPLTAKASRDDLIRANNGAYYGPASDY